VFYITEMSDVGFIRPMDLNKDIRSILREQFNSKYVGRYLRDIGLDVGTYIIPGSFSGNDPVTGRIYPGTIQYESTFPGQGGYQDGDLFIGPEIHTEGEVQITGSKEFRYGDTVIGIIVPVGKLAFQVEGGAVIPFFGSFQSVG